MFAWAQFTCWEKGGGGCLMLILPCYLPVLKTCVIFSSENTTNRPLGNDAEYYGGIVYGTLDVSTVHNRVILVWAGSSPYKKCVVFFFIFSFKQN